MIYCEEDDILRVYLAELSHTGTTTSPNVVPLSVGYIAAVAKQRFPTLQIKIFRDPERLLCETRMARPDMVGFSVHLWSERLSDHCARKIKEFSEEITTVAGGPSVDDIDCEISRFMGENRFFDVCIPNEGENGFLRLLEHVHTNGRLRRDKAINGCAFLTDDGSLIRGKYEMPDLKEIPSPYLGGFLDEFLKDGYDPMIQSMRGCPYSCKFCVSGMPAWSRLRAFDSKVVFDEFEYITKKTNSKYLILTDENFGILKERDIKIAEYIMKSYNAGGYPRSLYLYSAKIINEHVLKIVEILALIGEFGMSFQTMSEPVRKEIRRTNITYDQFLDCVKWAAQRKIMTSTEMIFGFPGETVVSYFDGIERLILSGVDRIYSYNLRMLSGIDMASAEDRRKYGLKTMFRLPERTYGVYDGTFVTETEEVVVGASSFDFDDYQQVRLYGLFLELACGRGYFTELIRIMLRVGMPGEKLVRFMVQYEYKDYASLSGVINDYQKKAREELFETADECSRFAEKSFANKKDIPEVKLNLIFTGRIMLNPVVKNELFEVIKKFIRDHSADMNKIAFLNEYLDTILSNQIVMFRKNERPVVMVKSRIRLDRIERNDFNSFGDVIGGDVEQTELDLHEDARNFLGKKNLENGGYDDSILQDIYMTVSRFGLLRKRKARSKVIL